MKETAINPIPLIHSVIPSVGIGQDRLRSMRVHRRLHACSNGRNRLIPGYALELHPWSLRTDSFHRIEQAVRSIHTLKEFVDLGAQSSAGERVFFTGNELYRFALVNGHFYKTGVGTIMRT